jgi:hypothetical protein
VCDLTIGKPKHAEFESPGTGSPDLAIAVPAATTEHSAVLDVV